MGSFHWGRLLTAEGHARYNLIKLLYVNKFAPTYDIPLLTKYTDKLTELAKVPVHFCRFLLKLDLVNIIPE